MMYGSRNMEVLSFWTIFCHFTPLTTQKIKILKKWRKKPSGDIIILHKCTINDNHIMYGSWDMERDGQNFCHFEQFLPLYPNNNPGNQNLSAPKIMIIWYTVCEIWRVTDVIVIFHFWAIFCPFTSGDIILHMDTKNYDQMICGSWDMVRDGRTVGRMEGKSYI